MSKEVRMPAISEDADSGTVVEILVQKGDTIEEEQSIIAVESDKASVEVPSTQAGTVKEIKISEGDEIKVDDLILILEENGKAQNDEEEETDEEDEKKQEKESKQKAKKKESDDEEVEDKEDEKEESEEEDEVKAKDESDEEEETKDKPSQKTEKTDNKEDQDIRQDEESRADVPAAPSVRRLSRELGIEIRQITGSGPGQRITEDDVKAFAKKAIQSNGQSPTVPSLPDFSKWGETEREKASNIRKITAEGTTQSWQTIPHVTHFDKANMTQLERFLEKYGEEAEKAGGKLTVTAILLKIAAAALKTFPKFNASIDMQNQEIVYKKFFHIGVAADTEQGLLVPVIQDVNQKSVIEITVELTKMAKKAREGKLSPEEMQGGTFTISNLGGIGGTHFTPIIYQHQAAILGVSRSFVEPVYENEEFHPKTMLPLALSYDHRLIDGAEAARFLRWVCRVIEDPTVMLMEGKV